MRARSVARTRPCRHRLGRSRGARRTCPLGDDALQSAMIRSQRASQRKKNRLVAVTLDENSIGRSNPDVEHERAVAINDLHEDNHYAPNGDDEGRFSLHWSITGPCLAFDIMRADATPVVAHLLSLPPLRRIVKDYYPVCDS